MGFISITAPFFPGLAPVGADPDMDEWNCTQFGIYWDNIKAAQGNTPESRTAFESEMARLGFFADCTTVSAGSCNLKKKLGKDGFDVDLGLVSGLICPISETGEAAAEAAAGTTKTLKFLIPAVLISGVVFVAANAKRIFKRG